MLKKILLLPAAIILTLIVLKPYFHPGFPYTHDGENHLARFANYKVALKEGQLPPRFAPNLMNHYGYPVFNYNYPLANILSLPFSALEINYETTFKLLVGIFVLTGLVGLYHWLIELKRPHWAIVFAMSTYALTPYLWTLILYRGNIGEIAAYSLFPWMLWLIEQAKHRSLKVFNLVLTTAFLLSHNVAVLFALPILASYSVLSLGWRQKRAWLNLGLAWLGGVGLSLWFWLPAIAEKNLVTVGEVGLVNNFTQHFSTLRELFFSPLSFGFSFYGSVDSLSFALGLITPVVLGLTLFLSIKRSWAQKQLVIKPKIATLIGLSLLLIVFQLKLTQPIWELVPLAAFIQFPWRLTLFLNVLVAGLSAYIWPQLKADSRWLLLILLFIQLISAYQAQPADYFHRTNVDYDDFSQSTTTLNENRSKDFSYQEIADWQPGPKLLIGGGEIKIKYWTGSSRQYQLNLNAKSTVVEPTMYFAGWKTWIIHQDHGRELVDYIHNEQTRGRIAYNLSPGSYSILSRFTQDTWARKVGNLVSLSILLSLVTQWIRRHFSVATSFFINWKLSLIVLSLVAPLFLVYEPSFPYSDTVLGATGLPQWLYSWVNFDGVHYLTIIKNGYLGTGLIQAFFPLFPLIIKWLNHLWSSPVLIGLIINSFFGFRFLRNWQQIIDLEVGADAQKIGMRLLFLFPNALFLTAFYSEALFLWLVSASLLNARQGKWGKASLMAALASATRVVGVALIPALLFELWQQHPAGIKTFIKHQRGKIFLIFCGALGLVTYMWYLYQSFGDGLYFFHVQSEFGGGRQESLIIYPQVVWRYLKIIWTYRPLDLKFYAYAQEFLVGVFGVVGLIWSWFKVRKSYVVFSALVFIIPTLTGTFSSLPRYFLACLSVFLLVTKLLKNRPRLGYTWLAVSTLLLIFNTILFIQGYWIA